MSPVAEELDRKETVADLGLVQRKCREAIGEVKFDNRDVFIDPSRATEEPHG